MNNNKNNKDDNTAQSCLGGRLGQMCSQELGHAKGLDPLLAEHRLHHLVRGEPLLVLGVLEEKGI